MVLLTAEKLEICCYAWTRLNNQTIRQTGHCHKDLARTPPIAVNPKQENVLVRKRMWESDQLDLCWKG